MTPEEYSWRSVDIFLYLGINVVRTVDIPKVVSIHETLLGQYESMKSNINKQIEVLCANAADASWCLKGMQKQPRSIE